LSINKQSELGYTNKTSTLNNYTTKGKKILEFSFNISSINLSFTLKCEQQMRTEKA
jgi:hypothetical protein